MEAKKYFSLLSDVLFMSIDVHNIRDLLNEKDGFEEKPNPEREKIVDYLIEQYNRLVENDK